jgi:tRNA A37 threonylcarbamoyladenosine dehydratase
VSELAPSVGDDPDLERRFGGLRRLYGGDGYARLRGAHVAVVGLGGVGSWAAEALARSGVAGLVLIDMDHVAESNINRQVQATGATLGQHKGEALRLRVADIHPGCEVQVVDDFVRPDNWPALLGCAVVDVLIDACDQVRAKAALAAWGLREGVPVVCVGAAGGKRQAHRVEAQDLALVTHDPLLSSLRQRLRQQGTAARHGQVRAMGVRCVFSRESVMAPVQDCAATPGAAQAAADGTLNCHGYGSSVVVTATFGMVAAGEAMALLLARATSCTGQGGAKSPL